MLRHLSQKPRSLISLKTLNPKPSQPSIGIPKEERPLGHLQWTRAAACKSTARLHGFRVDFCP